MANYIKEVIYARARFHFPDCNLLAKPSTRPRRPSRRWQPHPKSHPDGVLSKFSKYSKAEIPPPSPGNPSVLSDSSAGGNLGNIRCQRVLLSTRPRIFQYNLHIFIHRGKVLQQSSSGPPSAVSPETESTSSCGGISAYSSASGSQPPPPPQLPPQLPTMLVRNPSSAGLSSSSFGFQAGAGPSPAATAENFFSSTESSDIITLTSSMERRDSLKPIASPESERPSSTATASTSTSTQVNSPTSFRRGLHRQIATSANDEGNQNRAGDFDKKSFRFIDSKINQKSCLGNISPIHYLDTYTVPTT